MDPKMNALNRKGVVNHGPTLRLRNSFGQGYEALLCWVSGLLFGALGSCGFGSMVETTLG